MNTDPDDVVWRLNGGSTHRTSLLVLPHAGGNAHAYAEWRALLPDSVQLLIGQYPGRGARFSDPLPRNIGDLVGPIVSCLPSGIDDLVVLGHSMGSLVAFEVARALTRAGRAPRALVASACRAPFVANPSMVHPERLTDDELVAAIKARGGTDDGILDEPELREIIIPSLRADFALDDIYRYTGAAAPLTCPVTAIGGTDDPVVPIEALARWSEITDGPASMEILPGGHFYFQQQLDAFFSIVNSVVDGVPVRHEFA
ncbi:thioesterase II family protein [Streptomyces sp. AK02-01A]|uniref:thioesterase II family protein n=1 Tax=Streptomyces sp. AK02-01A TaxID=3028648 RepID=UPI0029A3F575|nr:alpha/beta fold hydrolase [Streptomyces sp. AK02-01A]MDX3855891.1 alpha/beta fold hydrolase [Streptomyces sp. AK02-01A]